MNEDLVAEIGKAVADVNVTDLPTILKLMEKISSDSIIMLLSCNKAHILADLLLSKLALWLADIPALPVEQRAILQTIISLYQEGVKGQWRYA